MKSMFRAAVVAACSILSVSLSASAQTLDRKIAYQGQLVGVTGSTTVQFRIFDDSGTPVWGPELHVVTPDAEGRFVAVVGATGVDVSPADGVPDLDQLAPGNLELEVAVEDPGGSTMTTLSPRQRLFAAFHAATVDRVLADGVATDAIQDQAVTTEKLADDSVTGAKVVDGAITGTQIADASVELFDLASSAAGARHYRQNDLLLRLGPCPSGFSDRSSPGGLLFATAGISEGQELQQPNVVAQSGLIDVYNVRICRCAQAVCN